MDLIGVGAVASAAKDILGMIFPNKTEEEKAQIAAAMALVQGQLDTNKAEAASPSTFVAGWRPFIGWVCGAACAWNWMGISIAKTACALAHYPINLAPADISEMMPILLGMLGLGAMRTVEKMNGVNSGH